ncbi:hypothetical protein M3231_15215 [Neobacillus mesonae]|nr:hypothetical protein [Neobacillus mesonae]
MVSKQTQELVDIVKGMTEEHAKKALASIFLAIESEGYGGKSKEDVYRKIEDIYRNEIVGPSIYKDNPAKQ